MADPDVTVAIRVLGGALARADARTRRHVQLILEDLVQAPDRAAALAAEAQSVLHGAPQAPQPTTPSVPTASLQPEDEAHMLDIARLAIQRVEQMELRPPQVNQTKAAEMLGVSTATVRNLLHTGVIGLNRCGLIPIEEIDRARVALKRASR